MSTNTSKTQSPSAAQPPLAADREHTGLIVIDVQSGEPPSGSAQWQSSARVQESAEVDFSAP